jgi:hypothetical protein
MLLLSFTVGTWVKAPGLKQAGRIVGFVADDDGQWRIVVADRIEGGEGELKRDYAPAELTIVPGERNAVLEACATAMLARRGSTRFLPFGRLLHLHRCQRYYQKSQGV